VKEFVTQVYLGRIGLVFVGVNRTRDSVFGTRQALGHTFLGNESEMFVGKHAFHTMFTFYTHICIQEQELRY